MIEGIDILKEAKPEILGGSDANCIKNFTVLIQEDKPLRNPMTIGRQRIRYVWKEFTPNNNYAFYISFCFAIKHPSALGKLKCRFFESEIGKIYNRLGEELRGVTVSDNIKSLLPIGTQWLSNSASPNHLCSTSSTGNPRRNVFFSSTSRFVFQTAGGTLTF